MTLPETINSGYGPGPHTSDHDVIHDILNVITDQGTTGQVLVKSATANPESSSGARLQYISLPDFSGFLSRSGGTMVGALAMGGNRITGLGTPTASTDAANKNYVDTHPAVAAGMVQTINHTGTTLSAINAGLGHTAIITLSANVTGFSTWSSWQPGQFASIWFVNPSGSGSTRTVALSALHALPGTSGLGTISLPPGAVYLLTVTSHNWSTRQYAFSGVLMESGA